MSNVVTVKNEQNMDMFQIMEKAYKFAEIISKSDIIPAYQAEYEYLIDDANNKLARNYVQNRNYEAQETKQIKVPIFQLLGEKENG